LEIGPQIHVVLANFLLRMRRNGQNSTFGQIFNPKSEIPMGCLLFEYEFWQRFRQDLYVFCAKTAFVMQNFRNLGDIGGRDETPKRHILAWFRAFWAIDGANPFTGFCSRCVHEQRTLQKVTERLYFTYLRGIPHPTKFNQNWHTSKGRRRNLSCQVW